MEKHTYKVENTPYHATTATKKTRKNNKMEEKNIMKDPYKTEWRIKKPYDQELIRLQNEQLIEINNPGLGLYLLRLAKHNKTFQEQIGIKRQKHNRWSIWIKKPYKITKTRSKYTWFI